VITTKHYEYLYSPNQATRQTDNSGQICCSCVNLTGWISPGRELITFTFVTNVAFWLSAYRWQPALLTVCSWPVEDCLYFDTSLRLR